MNPHIEKLLSVCKEATPGEWEQDCDNIRLTPQAGEEDGLWLAEFNEREDAHFSTTFQPRNVEKLLAAVNLLLQHLETRVLPYSIGESMDGLEEALEQLSKEVE